jgi:Tol biopolymer transport system component
MLPRHVLRPLANRLGVVLVLLLLLAQGFTATPSAAAGAHRSTTLARHEYGRHRSLVPVSGASLAGMSPGVRTATQQRMSFLAQAATPDTTQMDTDSGGTSGGTNATRPSISSDGRYVVFESGSALDSSDTDGTNDVYLKDSKTGVTTVLSVCAGSGAPCGGIDPMISADGTHVVFASSSAIVSGGTNTFDDIYEVDLTTSPSYTYSRVSKSTGGTDANGLCQMAQLSGTGRYVIFESTATNLVASDTNGVQDVFLRDTTSNTTTRISQGTGAVQSNGVSNTSDLPLAAISSDGNKVVFSSQATNFPSGPRAGPRSSTSGTRPQQRPPSSASTGRDPPSLRSRDRSHPTGSTPATTAGRARGRRGCST